MKKKVLCVSYALPPRNVDSSFLYSVSASVMEEPMYVPHTHGVSATGEYMCPGEYNLHDCDYNQKNPLLIYCLQYQMLFFSKISDKLFAHK